MSPDGLEDSPEMVPNHNNGFGYFSGKCCFLASQHGFAVYSCALLIFFQLTAVFLHRNL